MTGIETAMLVASMAISAVGAIAQGVAAKNAAEYNADIAKRNAVIARQQGDVAAKRQERDARVRAGASRAAGAASGVLLESYGDLLEDSAREEALDRMTILYNAELQAMSGEASAEGYRQAGRNAMVGGVVGAAGTLLKGASSLGWSSGAPTSGITWSSGRFPAPKPNAPPGSINGIGGV